ncbi:hypothetical protein BDL97_17G060500 [Sphagnum fallax]|nr:hypothetical protein BDL97_17G060500 [Sphagnum fallax]
METLLMGRRCCYVLCFIFIYYSQQSSCATIKVGGPVGWTNYDTSTNKPPDYATWVSSQSVVDDILVFKFPLGYHNSKATELNDGKIGSYSLLHQQKKPLHLLQAVLRLQHLCSECQHQLLLLVHL